MRCMSKLFSNCSSLKIRSSLDLLPWVTSFKKKHLTVYFLHIIHRIFWKYNINSTYIVVVFFFFKQKDLLENKNEKKTMNQVIKIERFEISIKHIHVRLVFLTDLLSVNFALALLHYDKLSENVFLNSVLENEYYCCND